MFTTRLISGIVLVIIAASLLVEAVQSFISAHGDLLDRTL